MVLSGTNRYYQVLSGTNRYYYQVLNDYISSSIPQVLPIIDLMAATNAHFRKLKEFITLQLPAGFPVKIGELLLILLVIVVVVVN